MRIKAYKISPTRIYSSKQLINRKDCRNKSHVKENEGSSNSESNHLQIVTSGEAWLRAEIFSKAKDQRLKGLTQNMHLPSTQTKHEPTGFTQRDQAWGHWLGTATEKHWKTADHIKWVTTMPMDGD